MKLSKKIARRIVLPAAMSLGFDRIMLGQTRKTCCIINFHGVRKVAENHLNNRHLPENDFENILKYLKSRFEIVSLEKMFEFHRSKRIPSRKVVALTFDDGYLNNFTVALPLLEKYQIPATFFIIGKSLAEEKFISWPDALDVLEKTHRADIELSGHRFKFPGFYCGELQQNLQGFLKSQGKSTVSVVNELMLKYRVALQDQVRKHPELLQLASANDLRKHCGNPLLEYGSHSLDHPNLEYLNREEQRIQLEASKKILEAICGRKVKAFAFPDGSYNQTTLAEATQAGYENLVAVDYRFNENNENPRLLSRFTISNSTTWQSNALRLAKQFGRFGL